MRIFVLFSYIYLSGELSQNFAEVCNNYNCINVATVIVVYTLLLLLQKCLNIILIVSVVN